MIHHHYPLRLRAGFVAGAALLLLLASCGESGSDQLNEAAEQSDPAAANVLYNEAANLSDSNLPSGSANSPEQQALQNAGNAAVTSGSSAPSSGGAVPHNQGGGSSTGNMQ